MTSRSYPAFQGIRNTPDCFRCVGATLLFITAVPALMSAMSGVNAIRLSSYEINSLLSNRQVVFERGGLELALSAFLLLDKWRIRGFLIAAGLAVGLLIHEGLLWRDHFSIGCLASLTDQLPITPMAYDLVDASVLCLVLVGSLACLGVEWRSRGRDYSSFASAKAGEKSDSRSALGLLPEMRRSCREFQVRLLCSWSLGIVVLAILHCHASPFLLRHLKSVAQSALLSQTIAPPIISSNGTAIFYVQLAWGGGNVWRVNPASCRQDKIDWLKGGLDSRDFKWLGWSPDERKLAYFVTENRTGGEIRVWREDAPGVSRYPIPFQGFSQSSGGVWVTTNALLFFGSPNVQPALLNLENDAALGPWGHKGFVALTSMKGRIAQSPVIIAEGTVAYVDPTGISSLTIATGKVKRVLELKEGQIEGLQYNPTTGNYLFALRGSRNGRDEMRIYTYEPGNDKGVPICLTSDYSMDPKWIQQNTGIVYVGTKEMRDFGPGILYIGNLELSKMGTNYLAVRALDQQACTNLFVGGAIQGYCIDSTGEKLYLTASERLKATCLWEYNIQQKSLREILSPGSRLPFVAPVEAFCTNNHGISSPYYYIQPPAMDSNRKYPALVDCYLADSSDVIGQQVANSGVFYVSAGHFGTHDWQVVPSPAQILSVRKALLSNPNVDPDRIFLAALSRSTITASEAVDANPGLWRGVILLSPVRLPHIPDKPGVFPSIFLSMGDGEELKFRYANEKFVEQAWLLHIRAQLDYPHAPHAYPPWEFVESYQAAMKFISIN